MMRTGSKNLSGFVVVPIVTNERVLHAHGSAAGGVVHDPGSPLPDDRAIAISGLLKEHNQRLHMSRQTSSTTMGG
jgi:hypothetical protein